MTCRSRSGCASRRAPERDTLFHTWRDKRRQGMRSILPALILAGSALLASPAAVASTELLELRNTILNLVDELVTQGVISAEKAEEMKRDAVLKAREQAAQAALAAGDAAEAQVPATPGTGVVRVPYVPEFVKDEIRAEVREELRAEVTEDVVARAREEKWGTPDALPAWLSRISLDGDFRLRWAGLYQDSGNEPAIPNFQAINRAGGFLAAGENAFLNTTEDTNRGQLRLRLGLAAELSDELKVVTRLATGNDTDPTTRNQRLGDYNRAFDLFVDLAYAQWRPGALGGDHQLTLRGGRLPNPYDSTSLLFDDDLTFDGLTAGYRGTPFDGGPVLVGNLGGYALLAEAPNLIDGGTNDKYWWGLQLGLEFALAPDWNLGVYGAWYDFIDVTGRRNEPNSTSRNWTAPAFIAKGNTVFDISNDDNVNTQLYALASEFELLNAMVKLGYSGFDPVHVNWFFDWVENRGFSAGDVSARVGEPVSKRNSGWFTQLEVGYPEVRARGEWQVFGGYKYLQRDAVLDSFTDSNFHAGGTDAQGWLAGILFGVAPNAWMRARWLSADEIDGAPAGFGAPFAPFAVDVLQVDFNAKF